MDTRFLQSFVAVVDCGSVADASRRLDLPATTVTQQMRSLEADIGCQLLTRVGRTVKPTVVGARLVDQAREVLRGVRELRSAASDTGLPAGPLRLGATPTALMGMVPALLRRWMSAHPTVQIYIEPGTSSKLLERVVDGNLDVAILVHPIFGHAQDLRVAHAQERGADSSCAARDDCSGPVAHRGARAVHPLRPQGGCGQDGRRLPAKPRIKPKVRFELDGIEHIAQLVAEGFGVSILPDWPAVGKPDGRTKRCPLPPPCPSREVGMVWSRSSVRSPLANALYDLVEQK
ncbi:LysR family transcriptional regulator [Variovorax paradoxus]|uniref:LysR family transcriptional regulator n=1 Tax=Variovorax paradoxus TaxID=34073 RepID=UPI0021AC36B7|nr:LysR family transcriptional regulator [Variovorax paradoxus]UVH60603.1 LysR family transcriptional regulator [Variovorax paradoxus]